MEMHQVHSEPKECGHCDVDYSLDAALQGKSFLRLHVSTHHRIAVLQVLQAS